MASKRRKSILLEQRRRGNKKQSVDIKNDSIKNKMVIKE